MKEITIEKLEHFTKDNQYMKLIDDIIDSLREDEIVSFVPGISQKWNPSEQTENYRKDLCEMIYPHLEDNIYSSPIKTIDVKFLRHLKAEGEIKEGAFNWHADNHPPEIINIIVYLTDVDERAGGMQYVEFNGGIAKRPFTQPAGGVVLEDSVQSIKENEPNANYPKMTGEKGTVFIFDNCIYHRASVPLDRDRDALLLQVEPSGERVV